MARCLKLECMANCLATGRFYCLPSDMGGFYAPVRSQIQQSTNYKIHVVPNVTHTSHDPVDDCWHHTNLPGSTAYSGSVLVRMGITDLVEWSLVVRVDES